MSEQEYFDAVKREFEKESGLEGLESEVREREGSTVLVIKVVNPTDRLFGILDHVRSEVNGERPDTLLVTLVSESRSNHLQGAEGKLLLRTLSESLNINRYSFKQDFQSRYTKSVFGAEEQVTASANHVVFGRRGAGKSTLLLYAMHGREPAKRPSVWVDMQVYARRDDDAVICDVLRDVIEQTSGILQEEKQHRELIAALQKPDSNESVIRQLLPPIRRLLAPLGAQGGELFVFLDDFHVVSQTLQPKLLDVMYGISRGNRIFLKISAIETLTRTFDPATRLGLEVPHDAQVIRLDYNLTMPDKATQHIQMILDSHAVYCGLSSIRKLCTSRDVLPRLTWVAAGVPRDGLNLFAQAMTKAILAGRKLVSVSDVNVATSEALNTKLKDLETDASTEATSLQELLEQLREFCIKQKRRNAFLVEIKGDDPLYGRVRKLVDLRLLHVITEGITIGEVGRKYVGLILDYGFYTGIRAAQSVDLFNRQTKRIAYKDLRHLPVYKQ